MAPTYITAAEENTEEDRPSTGRLTTIRYSTEPVLEA